MDRSLDIAICDDNEIMVNIVQKKLETYINKNEIEGCKIQLFSNGEQLLRSKQHFHILLLDIEMPEIDGFSLAERYRNITNAPIIIFLTSHRELMSRGYHVKAFRFLTKPLSDDDFDEALSSAIREVIELWTILLEKEGGIEVVMISDIKYIESLGEGCCIHTIFTDHITKEPMKYWEKRLPKDTIFRIHRATIVNLRHIKDIDLLESNLLLKSGEKLSISARKRKLLKDALHEHIRRKRGGT